MKIAILDDYQNVALEMADWSALSERAEIFHIRRQSSNRLTLTNNRAKLKMSFHDYSDYFFLPNRWNVRPAVNPRE
jgi:hypothetical protein